jgi:hypothetical protein
MVFNPVKPSGYFMYHYAQHLVILRPAHTVYFCALYGSRNKKRLSHYAALTDWFL